MDETLNSVRPESNTDLSPVGLAGTRQGGQERATGLVLGFSSLPIPIPIPMEPRLLVTAPSSLSGPIPVSPGAPPAHPQPRHHHSGHQGCLVCLYMICGAPHLTCPRPGPTGPHVGPAWLLRPPHLAAGVPGQQHPGQLGYRDALDCSICQMRSDSTLKVKAVKKKSPSEEQAFLPETSLQNTKTLELSCVQQRKDWPRHLQEVTHEYFPKTSGCNSDHVQAQLSPKPKQ